MKQVLKIFVFVLLIFPALLAGSGEPKRVSFVSYLGQDKIRSGDTVKVLFKVTVEKDWHINSNTPSEDYLIKTELKLADSVNFGLAGITYPKGKQVKLGFSDTPLSLYEGEFFISAKVYMKNELKPGEHFTKAVLSYQSCNNANCEFQAEAVAPLQLTVAAKGETVNTINDPVFQQSLQPPVKAKPAEGTALGDRLESSGLFLSLVLLFLAGLALNLTPCVYPLIPITIGFFGGQSEGKTSRLAAMGALYLLGISLTYSVIGVVTALSGALFGALLQNPLVVVFIVLLFIALSLSMFGLYEFKVPDSLMQKIGDSKGGLFGAFFMGLTMGIVAAPCIGPVVVSLVTVVAAKQDAWLGFLWFFFLSLGLGAPYFVLAIFSGKIQKLPRSGVWMDAVKHIFGFMLLALALYYAGPLLPKIVGHYALPVFMVITGGYLLFFEKAGNNLKGFKIFKLIFSLLVLVGGLYLLYPSQTGSIKWEPYTKEAFEAAKAKQQPIVLDFYADWCIPCKELDKATFSDPGVISESSGFAAFKVDLTSATSESAVSLTKEFKITGVPTVILINSQGVEAERITKFVEPDVFKESLRSVK